MSDEPMTREAFAEWLGRFHLGLEYGVEEVHYLPTGADPDVVRLLEVTRGLPADPDARIYAIECTAGPDYPYRTQIIDVSRAQWERIRAEPGRLPAGWRLDGGRQIFQGEAA